MSQVVPDKANSRLWVYTADPSMAEKMTPIPRHDPAPLRSRAEQIADELATQDLALQPTTRQLPQGRTPAAPRPPGR